MIKYPDYDDSILSLSNSILKHYNLEYHHKTIKEIDDLLLKNYDNVILMIFDGMGSYNINKMLDKDSFLIKHKVKNISSVFPPTTTAATTTLYSGLSPKEHGWLGWSLHFDEINDNINIFVNTNDDNVEFKHFNVANKIIPYESIVNRINNRGTANAFSVSQFGTNIIDSFDELFEEIENIGSTSQNNYIYTYWNEPDSSMHELGTDNDDVKVWFIRINKSVEKLSNKLKNTLIIVTADHGHIDIKGKCILDYPKLLKTLKFLPSVESRAISFFIKEGMHNQFEEEFNKNFKNDFLLLKHQKVMDMKLFGEGSAHRKTEDFIGDYLAIAINNITLFNSYQETNHFKGAHAGLTEEEMMVPLIAIECK
ncbi:alkaline phosphatase family protein [Sedimentibacter sp. zth1]|uniref:alkaline phosphatase family protein n=1 Tax=Sedimentibacter sp. zth1 TaxID=2816908 RepID=UPI001A936C7B|nr:alkaline phosphatase family protein [Sedimentibacter sp. zth1]QSX06536.1 alkaline phosphatase family protein [Sedimentibacter sp. zth1]